MKTVLDILEAGLGSLTYLSTEEIFLMAVQKISAGHIRLRAGDGLAEGLAEHFDPPNEVMGVVMSVHDFEFWSARGLGSWRVVNGERGDGYAVRARWGDVPVIVADQLQGAVRVVDDMLRVVLILHPLQGG